MIMSLNLLEDLPLTIAYNVLSFFLMNAHLAFCVSYKPIVGWVNICCLVIIIYLFRTYLHSSRKSKIEKDLLLSYYTESQSIPGLHLCLGREFPFHIAASKVFPKEAISIHLLWEP